jgi:hypothetical protein
MHNQNHRANAVAGLRALASFLDDGYAHAKLNEYSRIDVNYCVLEGDRRKARAEFRELANFMNAASGSVDADFIKSVGEYNGDLHHVAALEFANGAVAYQVTWIEKTQDEETGQ